MPNRPFPVAFSPKRIVSLVPSMTETLFELGFGSNVVGVSDYCTCPQAKVSQLPRVGGTRSTRIVDVLGLDPDLVIANQEENERDTIEKIMQQGVPVWLTFPLTVDEMLEDLWTLSRAFRSDFASLRVRSIEKALEYARMAADGPKFTYFCPIWQEKHLDIGFWWMTFNQQTYSHDLLNILGGQNIFGSRVRRYPLDSDLNLAKEESAGGRDTRYPRVTIEEIVLGDPKVILLPDEPFSFANQDGVWLAETIELASSHKVRTIRIDGSLITWPGIRLAQALAELPPLFS